MITYLIHYLVNKKIYIFIIIKINLQLHCACMPVYLVMFNEQPGIMYTLSL